MMAIERILVPIDFSPPSLRALDDAAEFSLPYEAQLIVLHVVERARFELPPAKEKAAAGVKLAQIQRRLTQRGIDCRTLVRSGSPYKTIIDEAQKIKANLIVISTHGWTGLAEFLIGSVAERIVRGSPCPVLVIRTLPLPQPAPKRARR
jgi:nucleotide-binding universal stress UspA family protein